MERYWSIVMVLYHMSKVCKVFGRYYMYLEGISKHIKI
jgi:hypothetical protein